MFKAKKILEEVIAVILVLTSTVGFLLATFAYKDEKMEGKIELLAKAPERGSWYPNTIYAKSGEEITVLLRNIDVVSHGFYLPHFEIMIEKIKAGEVKEIKFTPNKKVEFPFYCIVWCGDYHMQMRGKLVVE